MQKGSRVKHNKLGLETLKPRNPDRIGTVKVVSKFSNEQTFCSIVWDGTKTCTRYACKFLEEIKT